MNPPQIAPSILTRLLKRIGYRPETDQDKILDAALEACRLIQAVKHCMMFDRIHADWMVREILVEHKAQSIQYLAKMAQDKADEVLGDTPPQPADFIPDE